MSSEKAPLKKEQMIEHRDPRPQSKRLDELRRRNSEHMPNLQYPDKGPVVETFGRGDNTQRLFVLQRDRLRHVLFENGRPMVVNEEGMDSGLNRKRKELLDKVVKSAPVEVKKFYRKARRQLQSRRPELFKK